MKNKVLVCAYSCLSESGVKVIGGEAVLGWNLVLQLSRFNDVFILTHHANYSAIEGALSKKPILNVKFYYIKLPAILSFLEKWHGGGIQVYSYLWQIKAYFIVKKLHKKVHFNVFHHITYANDWMASFIGALLPVPYIRGPGGGAQRAPSKFLRGFTFKEKAKEKLRSLGQWFFRHDPFFILGQKKAKAILVCNYESQKIIPKKWRDKTHLFSVNGISKEELNFLPPEKKLTGKFRVISAGKLIKIKGFDLAIKAFRTFREEVSDAEFIIVGEGPELFNLRKLISDFGLEEKIKIEKWTSRENLLKKISASNVFLFPSLRDGGGAVVVEAMGAGKPVVCFDVAGPGFHIDEKCGIKIKPESPEQTVNDTAKALEKLYLDEELRIKLGEGAKEKAEKEYDWDKLGEKLNEIYKKVLLL